MYPSVEDAEAGRRAGGTGFLIASRSAIWDTHWYVYAVTNWHVVDHLRGASPVIRINTRDGGAVSLPLTEADWERHPDGDDVAICQPVLTPVHEYRFAIKVEEFLTNELEREHNIGPGDDTYLLGRFVDHEGVQRVSPSVRFGNIAMMPGDAIRLENGHLQEAYLVESRSISGYSGSPVFVHIPMLSYRWRDYEKGWAHQAGPWLLGIDCAHLPFNERASMYPRQNRTQVIGSCQATPE